MRTTQDICIAPVCERLWRTAPRGVWTLVITGYDQPDNARRVKDLGGAAYSLTQVNEPTSWRPLGPPLAMRPEQTPAGKDTGNKIAAASR